jgi:hypothetical protein
MGSTFTLALPLALAQPEVPPATSLTPEPELSVPRLHVLASDGEADSESRLA